MDWSSIELYEESILAMKVGDRVWSTLSSSVKRVVVLRTVTKVTGTQIHLGLSAFWKIKSKRPYRYIGKGVSGNNSLLRVATLEECQQWDAEQIEKENQRNRNREITEKREALRQELASLFQSELVEVHDSYDYGSFQLVIGPLSEEQIRAIHNRWEKSI
jgi:hypothetical protein